MRLRDRAAFRSIRKRAGTLRVIAHSADVSHQFLSELELGDKELCSRDVAEGIAEAVGVGVDELFVPADVAPSGTEADEQKVS